MGGERHRATTSRPLRHPDRPQPSFLLPLSVIPAQAGTRAPPPSFLRRQEPAPPLPSFLRRQEPAPPSPSFLPPPQPSFPHSHTHTHQTTPTTQPTNTTAPNTPHGNRIAVGYSPPPTISAPAPNGAKHPHRIRRAQRKHPRRSPNNQQPRRSPPPPPRRPPAKPAQPLPHPNQLPPHKLPTPTSSTYSDHPVRIVANHQQQATTPKRTPPQAPNPVIPAPPQPVIPAQAGTTTSTHHAHPHPVIPAPPPTVIPAQAGTRATPPSFRPPSRHSCAPPPSFLRRQEPPHPRTTHTPIPSFPRPPPSFLRRQEPPHPRTHPPTPPLPNSSLPPFRGEARWGVGGHEPAPQFVSPPIPPAAPTPHLRRARPFRHFCAPTPVIPTHAGTTLYNT